MGAADDPLGRRQLGPGARLDDIDGRTRTGAARCIRAGAGSRGIASLMAAGAVDANGETSDDGTRSSAGLGLRAIVDMARATARSDPALWLLGALSFCVRGGVLVVLLPILWVPTPVLLSIFLAPYLTSSGPSAEAIPAVAVSGGVAIVLVAVAIVTAAFVDLASFERVARNPAVAGVGGRPGLRGVAGGNRSATTLGLIYLSVIGLVPVVAALVPVAFRPNAAAMSELQLPTRLDTPFAFTVIGRVAPGVILLVAIVVVADLFVTLASRELLAARFGLRGTTVHVGPLAALTL